MNQLCLSAALLVVIMGTPVAHTQGGATSNQAQDKSQFTSPLQAGAEGGWWARLLTPGAVFPNPLKEPEKNSRARAPVAPLGTRDWLSKRFCPLNL